MDIQASELALCNQLQEMNLLRSDRIKNLVIATHSKEIHTQVQELLDKEGNTFFENIPPIGYPVIGQGKDGLIVAGK